MQAYIAFSTVYITRLQFSMHLYSTRHSVEQMKLFHYGVWTSRKGERKKLGRKQQERALRQRQCGKAKTDDN